MSRVNEARDGARPQFLARPEQFLEMMPFAGYACDQDGLIVHYNRQAAELWGRRPTLHDPQQRFCGSLRLYWPDGTPLPHAECPMAESLRTGTPVRDGQILSE